MSMPDPDERTSAAIHSIKRLIGPRNWQKLEQFWGHESFKRFRASGWFIPLVVVAFIALIGSLFGAGGHGKGDSSYTPGQPLRHDRTYYIWISEISLYSRYAGWDLDSSGPDIAYEIYLGKGNERVFKSDVRNDTLLAQWSAFGFDYSNELRGLFSSGTGKTSLEEMIQAARVQASAQPTITVRVLDKDVVQDEVAGTYDIPLASLRVGSNPFALEEAPGQSEVSTITIEVVPTDGFMAYLKQTYGQ